MRSVRNLFSGRPASALLMADVRVEHNYLALLWTFYKMYEKSLIEKLGKRTYRCDTQRCIHAAGVEVVLIITLAMTFIQNNGDTVRNRFCRYWIKNIKTCWHSYIKQSWKSTILWMRIMCNFDHFKMNIIHVSGNERCIWYIIILFFYEIM